MRIELSKKDGMKYYLDGYRTDSRQLESKIDGNFGVNYEVECVVDISDIAGHKFKVLNGVTGYESWYIESLLRDDRDNIDFVVCAGTPYKYDKLAIKCHEWLTFVDHYKKTYIKKDGRPRSLVDLTYQEEKDAMERFYNMSKEEQELIMNDLKPGKIHIRPDMTIERIKDLPPNIEKELDRLHETIREYYTDVELRNWAKNKIDNIHKAFFGSRSIVGRE